MNGGGKAISFTPFGYEKTAKKRRRTHSTSTICERADERYTEMQSQIDALKRKLAESEALVIELTDRNEQLKKDQAAAGRVSDLFRRRRKGTRRHSSGRYSGLVRPYGTKMNALAVACLAEGVPAAHIKRVLDALAFVCELLTSDDDRVPNADWFVKKRLELKALNDAQLLAFVKSATFLSASYDETSLHSKKIGCLGLTNEQGEYMAAGFDLVLGRTGVEIAGDMSNIIDKLTMTDDNEVSLATLIRQKLSSLMTDRSRTQECANRHFVEMLDTHNDRAGLPGIVILICLMHCTSNAEKYFTSVLSADTLRAFALIRRIFGCRENSPYNKHGLARALGHLTDSKHVYESALGCRFGTFYRNGRALLNNENMTKICLEERENITNLQMELIDLMNGNAWERIRLEFGMFFAIWLFGLEKFHSTMSKPNVSLGVAKTMMRLCLAR